MGTKLHRRALSIFTALTLMLLLLPSGRIAAEARVVHNLVLFAQFPGDGNFTEGRADEIQALCSQTGTFRSLAGYIDAISYGQMQTDCYFPQLDGGTITPYRLSRPAEDYANRELLALEILRGVSVPESIPLDGNNDGIIDNVILITDGTAENRSDLLWNTAFTVPGVSLSGKKVGWVNLHTLSNLLDASPLGGVGVLSHEFLHSMGYPDLYRSEGEGTPVGLWDIMASSNVYVQYPLAYLRASVSGWLDTADITENGTYTLSPASAPEGNRVFLLKTPLSDTEFFAVEFRHKGTRFTDAMDTYIYGSGLVVYRVNTEAEGNLRSDKDEIYVFRPGETTQYGGFGTISESNFGGEGRQNFIGSLNPEDGIAEGALTYSDGTNSGIRIENITIEGDTLRFDVQFAEIDSGQLWQTVPGASALKELQSLALAASESGNVFLAGSDGSRALLYQIKDGVLTEIGALPGSGTFSVNEIQLTVCGETPYILYRDQDYNAVLYACTDGFRKVWQSGGLAQYTGITSDGENVYIGYTQGYFPYALYALRYADGKVTELGKLADNAVNLSLACKGNTVAVGFRDFGDNSRPKLALWENGNVSITALSEYSSNTVEITSDGEGFLAAFTGALAGSEPGMVRFRDGKTEAMEFPALPGKAFAAIPVIAGGTVFTASGTQSGDDFSVYRFDGAWKRLGNQIADEVVTSPAALISGDTFYTAYISGGGNTVVKALKLAESRKLAGDVNADGTVSLADAVLLQKWILRTGVSLPDGKAGDLDGNGVLNVIDLVLLKRLVLA